MNVGAMVIRFAAIRLAPVCRRGAAVSRSAPRIVAAADGGELPHDGALAGMTCDDAAREVDVA
jgi:hypothetical protein